MGKTFEGWTPCDNGFPIGENGRVVIYPTMEGAENAAWPHKAALHQLSFSSKNIEPRRVRVEVIDDEGGE